MARKRLPMGIPIKSDGGVIRLVPDQTTGDHIIIITNSREYPVQVTLDQFEKFDVEPFSFGGVIKYFRNVGDHVSVEMTQLDYEDPTSGGVHGFGQVGEAELFLDLSKLAAGETQVVELPGQNYYLVEFDTVTRPGMINYVLETEICDNTTKVEFRTLNIDSPKNNVIYADIVETVFLILQNITPEDFDYKVYSLKSLTVHAE